jgi:hypothetical protein
MHTRMGYSIDLSKFCTYSTDSGMISRPVISSPSYPTIYSTPNYSSGGSSSGRCVSPNDRDSRGRRCGGRASDVRPGGR